MDKICRDLEAEYRELDDVVSGLDITRWYLETPFYGWTIFDEVAHIAFFDHEAMLAIDTPDRFRARAEKVMQTLMMDNDWPAYINALLGQEHPDALVSIWRKTRTAMINRLSRMDAKDRGVYRGRFKHLNLNKGVYRGRFKHLNLNNVRRYLPLFAT